MGAVISALTWLAKAAAILLPTGGILLFIFQDKLLYFPQMPPGAQTHFENPSQFGVAARDIETDVEIITSDSERLQAWFVRPSSSAQSKVRPTILFFHGNAGNLSHRLPLLRLLFHACGCNVLIVSYRGYGRSTGKPSEKGLRLDAEASLKYLVEQRSPDWVDKDRIILLGRSLGGAVALHLARLHSEQIAGCIVENTFTSIPDMMGVVLPWIKWFRWLSWNRWDSARLIADMPATVPLLFLSSDKDELVPPYMMHALHAGAAHCRHRSIHVIERAGHMDAYLQPSYVAHIRSFLHALDVRRSELLHEYVRDPTASSAERVLDAADTQIFLDRSVPTEEKKDL